MSYQKQKNQTSPWDDLFQLHKEVNRMFSSAWDKRLLDPSSGSTKSFPMIDITMGEKLLTLQVQLPGVKKSDIHLQAKQNVLIISGERKRAESLEADTPLRSEITFGTFERHIELPEGAEMDKISARYEHGILEIAVPLRDTAQFKEIPIQS